MRIEEPLASQNESQNVNQARGNATNGKANYIPVTTFGSGQNQTSSQCMTNVIQVYRDSLETESKDQHTSTSARYYKMINSSQLRNEQMILINNQTE